MRRWFVTAEVKEDDLWQFALRALHESSGLSLPNRRETTLYQREGLSRKKWPSWARPANGASGFGHK